MKGCQDNQDEGEISQGSVLPYAVHWVHLGVGLVVLVSSVNFAFDRVYELDMGLSLSKIDAASIQPAKNF